MSLESKLNTDSYDTTPSVDIALSGQRYATPYDLVKSRYGHLVPVVVKSFEKEGLPLDARQLATALYQEVINAGLSALGIGSRMRLVTEYLANLNGSTETKKIKPATAKSSSTSTRKPTNLDELVEPEELEADKSEHSDTFYGGHFNVAPPNVSRKEIRLVTYAFKEGLRAECAQELLAAANVLVDAETIALVYGFNDRRRLEKNSQGSWSQRIGNQRIILYFGDIHNAVNSNYHPAVLGRLATATSMTEESVRAHIEQNYHHIQTRITELIAAFKILNLQPDISTEKLRRQMRTKLP